jgi:tetratricopeptide (TPR) repeat protein
LDGHSSPAYLSRGVGNYYLPQQFGGGVDLALNDFDKAIALNPNLSDAYLWKGIALRKVNRNKEARQAIEKAVQLSPDWVWAKDQLQKTPAQ